MSVEDGPGRFETDAPLSLSRAARKFGIGTCALAGCEEQFIKHRHGQKYCCTRHKQEAINRRARHYSADPKWMARRERKRRLEARRSNLPALVTAATIATTWNGISGPKYRNKNNDLQRVFLGSSMGISGSGTSRAVFSEILALDLANVPIIRSVPAA